MSPHPGRVPAVVTVLRVLAALAGLAAVLGAGYVTGLGRGHALSPTGVLTAVTAVLAIVAGFAAHDVRQALSSAAPRRT